MRQSGAGRAVRVFSLRSSHLDKDLEESRGIGQVMRRKKGTCRQISKPVSKMYTRVYATQSRTYEESGGAVGSSEEDKKDAGLGAIDHDYFGFHSEKMASQSKGSLGQRSHTI
jgi:hypothetical protein